MKRNKKIYLLLLCLIIGGVVSIGLGQDANWDLKNYHLYNAWAYFNNKLAADPLAAGIQSYFAPLLDLPYYLLATQWLPNSPRTVAFMMGMPYGVLLFVVFLLAWLLIGDFEIRSANRIVLCVLATAFGVSGVATISQVGTTFNEIPTAAITLTGLLFIVIAIAKSRVDEANAVSIKYLILSGIFFGAAAGLKLTACLYAPGGAIAVLVIQGTVKQRIYRAAIFSAAWAAAFLVLWGGWGLGLYKLTGNPFFPLFNSIFRSAWIPPSGGLDLRFMPKSLMEAIFYPFYWANNSQMTVMEPRFADPRFAIALGLAFVALILRVPIFLQRAIQRGSVPININSTGAVLLFSVISYVAWEGMFSILRYAATLESILGLIVFVLSVEIFKTFKIASGRAVHIGVLALALVVAVVYTRYPDWGRAPFSKSVFEIKSPRIPSDSLVLFVGSPEAYLAPFIAKYNKKIDFVGINYESIGALKYELGKIITQKIANWEGPIFYVVRKENFGAVEMLKSFALYPNGKCSKIVSNIDAPIYICPASRTLK